MAIALQEMNAKLARWRCKNGRERLILGVLSSQLVFYGFSLTKIHELSKIPKYFCAVYDYAGKANLNYGNSKRKLGVTTIFFFFEIIKQQLF